MKIVTNSNHCFRTIIVTNGAISQILAQIIEKKIHLGDLIPLASTRLFATRIPRRQYYYSNFLSPCNRQESNDRAKFSQDILQELFLTLHAKNGSAERIELLKLSMQKQTC